MKKLFLFAALAVFGFTQLNAQAKFGAKAGANLANLVGDIEENKMLFGFHIGAVAEFAISEDFFIAPELLFSTQGTKSEYSESIMGMSIDVKETLKLNYITIPVMAKYQVADGFTLEAGPQIGFLMSANADVYARFGGETESGSGDATEFVNSMDFGLNLGLGYRVEHGLFFQRRYHIGLPNVADNDHVKLDNSVTQFSVGYVFN